MKFKEGNRIKRVKEFNHLTPEGYQAVVKENNSVDMVNGNKLNIVDEYWELVKIAVKCETMTQKQAVVDFTGDKYEVNASLVNECINLQNGCHGPEKYYLEQGYTVIPYSQFEQEYLGVRGSSKDSTSSNTLTELPKKWCVEVTNDNLEKLIEWRNQGKNSLTKHGLNRYLHSNKVWNRTAGRFIDEYGKYGCTNVPNCNNWHDSNHVKIKEITFDQFKKWVLKENNFKFEIGDKVNAIEKHKQSCDLVYTGSDCGFNYLNHFIVERSVHTVDKKNWYKLKDGAGSELLNWFNEEGLEKTEAPPKPITVLESTYNGETITTSANTPTDSVLTPFGKERLLEEARRRYPVGTKFKGRVENIEVVGEIRWSSNQGNVIFNGNGYGMIYNNGKWAEIIEPVMPESNGLGDSSNFSVGDWVTKDTWTSEPIIEQIRAIEGDTASIGSYRTCYLSKDKDLRKATPEEITKAMGSSIKKDPVILPLLNNEEEVVKQWFSNSKRLTNKPKLHKEVRTTQKPIIIKQQKPIKIKLL